MHVFPGNFSPRHSRVTNDDYFFGQWACTAQQAWYLQLCLQFHTSKNDVCITNLTLRLCDLLLVHHSLVYVEALSLQIAPDEYESGDMSHECVHFGICCGPLHLSASFLQALSVVHASVSTGKGLLVLCNLIAAIDLPAKGKTGRHSAMAWLRLPCRLEHWAGGGNGDINSEKVQLRCSSSSKAIPASV